MSNVLIALGLRVLLARLALRPLHLCETALAGVFALKTALGLRVLSRAQPRRAWVTTRESSRYARYSAISLTLRSLAVLRDSSALKEIEPASAEHRSQLTLRLKTRTIFTQVNRSPPHGQTFPASNHLPHDLHRHAWGGRHHSDHPRTVF